MLQQITKDQIKAILGSDHDETLAALDNLGVTPGSWQRFNESMEIHRQVLIAREKRPGATDLDTLTKTNSLAIVLLDLNAQRGENDHAHGVRGAEIEAW